MGSNSPDKATEDRPTNKETCVAESPFHCEIRSPKDQERFKVKNDYGRTSLPAVGSFVADIPGLGYIEFGASDGIMCGAASGIEFNSTNKGYGYSGGVMDFKTVIALHDWLGKLIEQKENSQ